MMSIKLIYDDVFLKHKTPPFHPESPERLNAIIKAIKEDKDIEKFIQWLKPRKATKEEILLVHNEDYYDYIVNTKPGYLDSDTYLSEGSIDAALFAAGTLVKAVELAKEQSGNRFFCLVRPPGHHAERNKAMGFCIFNNVAVGAAYAKKSGFKKVYIIDFDVHHGNGTQHIFEEDPDVFYFSTHQMPLYPGTGKQSEKGTKAGLGTTLNIPLKPGAGDKEFIEIYGNILFDSMKQFNPNIVFVSAGYDLRDADPLASLSVTKNGIREIIKSILNSSGTLPVIFTLEGGYNLKALSESVLVTLEVMANI